MDDLLNREMLFHTGMFPVNEDTGLTLGDRKLRINYLGVDELVRNIRNRLKKTLMKISISNKKPKGTSGLFTVDGNRNSDLDSVKVKELLTGNDLDNPHIVEEIDREINANNNERLQYFLYFNIFEDGDEFTTLFEYEPTQKTIFRNGVSVKEAEMIIHVATCTNSVYLVPHLDKIIPYIPKSTLNRIIEDVQNYFSNIDTLQGMLDANKGYFDSVTAPTFNRLLLPYTN